MFRVNFQDHIIRFGQALLGVARRSEGRFPLDVSISANNEAEKDYRHAYKIRIEIEWLRPETPPL